jgi:hypothetical protein
MTLDQAAGLKAPAGWADAMGKTLHSIFGIRVQVAQRKKNQNKRRVTSNASGRRFKTKRKLKGKALV